jgi:hypothetical protein
MRHQEGLTMHVSQTLELALSLLDNDPDSNAYMCCHLDWMAVRDYITGQEANDAKDAILPLLGGWVTLAQYLRDTKAMPQHVAVLSPEYRHYQLTFYRGLIARLRAEDPMFLIIEAAYHCAHSMAEVHAAVKAAGLPETSDETIANLLGEYAQTIKE